MAAGSKPGADEPLDGATPGLILVTAASSPRGIISARSGRWNSSMPRSLIVLVCLVLTACAHSDRSPPDEVWTPREGWIDGVVFDDRNADGQRQGEEPGVASVRVSNGRDVVLTDGQGRYRLPVRPDMNLTVVQPRGWRVPVDERQLPQFFLVHKAGGSPPLRYGGLPDRALPPRVDFPLHRIEPRDAFRCVIIGDSQTYSNREVSFFRDSAAARLLGLGLEEGDCIVYVGDVLGDDLDLLDRLMEVGSVAGVPQWLVHGNHDLDFDAPEPAHSADSWRARAMPDYYAFEIGEVLFVALNNVAYPCAPEEMTGRSEPDHCSDPEDPKYNGRVSEVQMQWLQALMATTPSDQRVVLMHHIPFVSFHDSTTPVHQTDNVTGIYELVAPRPALSLAGHTHTLENLSPGDSFAGWRDAVQLEALPFRHIIAGAASGTWWMGDFEFDGIPLAMQRMGAPRGLLTLDFDGDDYVETFHSTSFGRDRAQWVSFNTPDFRAWYRAIADWMDRPADERDPIPPRSLHDLGSYHLFTPADLVEGVYLTVNVWLGSSETRVRTRFNGGDWVELDRTQRARGESPRRGAEFVDPFSARRVLSMARQALVSRSGNERAQGYEAFKGSTFQGPPGPMGRRVPDKNVHLWRYRLPERLALGVHRAEVVSIDRHGRKSVDHVVFEVREQRPKPGFDLERWNRLPAGR